MATETAAPPQNGNEDLDEVVSAAHSRVKAKQRPAESQPEGGGALHKVGRWFGWSDEKSHRDADVASESNTATARTPSFLDENDEGFADIRPGKPMAGGDSMPQPVSSVPAGPVPVKSGSDDSGFAPVSTVKRWFGFKKEETPPPSNHRAPVIEGAAEAVESTSTPSKVNPRQYLPQPKKTVQNKPKSKPKQRVPSKSEPKQVVQTKPKPRPTKPDYAASGKRKLHTIQLTSSAQKSGFKAQLSQNQLSVGQAWVFEEERNGQRWYSLFYGRYDSLELALDAMEKLPKRMSGFSPWIRKVEISP